MKIDKTRAATLLHQEANAADKSPDPGWVKKVEKLSRLCEEGVSKTHIAFLGTAMLAKAIDRKADLFAIKPEHAHDNPNAFSARTLCHQVLVPISAEIGFSIGVTGREPLNNQPYFRMTRLDDGTPVHAGGKAAFDYMLELVQELQKMRDENTARAALRAFVHVRRKYQPRYAEGGAKSKINPAELTVAISALVTDDSEGGRRAQAVVAGLMDLFASSERVESGRINDPSRKYPGDVCVRSSADPTIWEKSIEVRDKPVSQADIQIYCRRCIDFGVREAAVVMTSERQSSLDAPALGRWAEGFGIGLTLFHGWESFVEQALFWSELPKPVGAVKAVTLIRDRLIGVEASPRAIELWKSLTSKK